MGHLRYSNKPSDIGEGWQDWENVRSASKHPKLAVFWDEGKDHPKGPHYNDKYGAIYGDGTGGTSFNWGLVYAGGIGGTIAWMIGHEYGHYVHDCLGDGVYWGNGLTYDEGVAEMFSKVLPSLFDDGPPVRDELDGDGNNRQYEWGSGQGHGVREIFWDMLDDCDDSSCGDADGLLDGIQFQFGYIWYALLRQTGDIYDFWLCWLECGYTQVEPDPPGGSGLSWNQHVINIYSLHGLYIGIVQVPSGGGENTFGGLTLANGAGSVQEDTDISISAVSASSVSMVSNMYVLLPLNDTGELVFSGPAFLTITYDDTALSLSQEESLSMHYDNPATGTWEPQTSTVDTNANTVSTQITHLSDYAVGLPELGDPPAQPTGFSLTDDVANSGTAELAWTENTEIDLAGYFLRIATVANPEGTSEGFDPGDTSHQMRAIEPGSYTLTLYAYDVDGNRSDPAVLTLDVIDIDADGLPDDWELAKLGHTASGATDDDDGDGVDNLTEYQYGTDPDNPDSDSDQMPDGWEMSYGLDPLDATDASEDPDGDGLTNLEEYQQGSNPRDSTSPSLFLDISAGLTGVEQCSLSWGDYDNDGDLDLALAGGDGTGGYVSKIYRNNGGVFNTAPAAPGGLSASVVGDGLTFSWTAASDNETPADGLSHNLRVGTTPGDDDVFCGMADLGTGLRRIPATGNAQKRLVWTVKGLQTGTYFWSVQAIDTAFAGSAWAEEEETAFVPIPGDTNYDGAVDVIDLGSLAGNYGVTSGATWQMGDFNGDGNVDIVDLGALAGNYGMGVSAPIDFAADWATLKPASAGDTPADEANAENSENGNDETISPVPGGGCNPIAAILILCMTMGFLLLGSTRSHT